MRGGGAFHLEQEKRIMKKDWFRRGGLIDFERLDTRAKILLILAFAILQPFVVYPVGLFLVFSFLALVIIPFVGIIPPTFMEETPLIVGYSLTIFAALSGFCAVSWPIAWLAKLPGKVILLLAVLSVLGMELISRAYSKIFFQ